MNYCAGVGALTVRRGHSPVVGNWAADEEKRQLGSDKADCNIDGDPVDPFPLAEALSDEDQISTMHMISAIE